MQFTKDMEEYIDVLRYHLELLMEQRDEVDRQITEFRFKIQQERNKINEIKE
jgi:peptidoglycan hydrolase CwlO-like protein